MAHHDKHEWRARDGAVGKVPLNRPRTGLGMTGRQAKVAHSKKQESADPVVESRSVAQASGLVKG
jgi:hypothetical protein